MALKLDNARFDVVTSPYDFAMLCQVAKRALALAEDEETKKEEIERTFDACLGVNTVRNQIVHGAWLVGEGTRHVSRQTLKPKIYFKEVEEIDEKTGEIKTLTKDVAAFGPTSKAGSHDQMKPNSFPMLPMSPKGFRSIPCWSQFVLWF